MISKHITKSKPLVMTNFLFVENLSWKLCFLKKNWRLHLKIVLMNYVRKLHLISLYSFCISAWYGLTTIWIWPDIFRREGWKYFPGKVPHDSWLLFPIYLSCLETLLKKRVSSQMQVHSLSHINWRLHSIYLWNISIVSVHVLQNKKKMFAVCSWCNIFFWLLSRSIEGLMFCHSFWSWKSHGIYFVEFCGHPLKFLTP